MEELEFPYTAGGGVNWHNHFEKQYGSFFKISMYTYHKI